MPTAAGAVTTIVRRAGLPHRRPVPGPTVALRAAACQHWSRAGTATELRMLRPGPRPGIPGRDHLHLRVHLVPRLRAERPARRLPELRRRTRPAPHPPGPPARSRPAIGQAGSTARLHPRIRPLIRPYRRRDRPDRRGAASPTRPRGCWIPRRGATSVPPVQGAGGRRASAPKHDQPMPGR